MTRPPNKRVSRGQPIRRGAPAKKGCPLTMALPVALIVVGSLGLLTHLWLPFLLLASLPTKAWRRLA